MSSKAFEDRRVANAVADEKGRLQHELDETKAILAKQSEELDGSLTRHMKALAKLDELRSSSAIKEANFQTQAASLSSRVEDLRENNIEPWQSFAKRDGPWTGRRPLRCQS